MLSEPANEQTEQPSAVGRYALVGKLGSGGMGVVYRAQDTSTGKTVALKQLLSNKAGEHRRTLEALFQREFHTLSGLRHPRIIEVYDYGHAEQGPYYTMELLSGKGLAELAPLPYKEACRHVRDVASSLALLHAHRLVHRDVSPGNVRLSAEGRAKLLDFGALATFGAREDIIGTPPCIAPEVLNWSPLDQRTDLFSLGALLYWALTRRHAFPARKLADLFEAWQVPLAPPSSLVAGVPKELDALVSSLLSMDPLARPASAALAIERLNAIAELDSENEEHARESYLRSSPMIGRKAEIDQLLQRVDQGVAGQGGALLIQGPSGIGKSRLLHELCVEAQLKGVTVLRASGENAVGSFSLVSALIDSLLHVAPDPAGALAKPYEGVLAHVSDVLRDKLGVTTLAQLPADLGERRVVIQSALHSWFLDVARDRPLLLAVDDAQAADPNSATFLAALAREAGELPLLIVATHCTGTRAAAPAAFKMLTEKAAPVKLAGLDLPATEIFIKALFGDVSNTGRLARWIHERSGGHPDHCIGLVQLVVRSEIARYVDGTWVLPLEIASGELPSRLEDLLEVRLMRLSPHARKLAEALAVHGRALAIEHCLPLLKNLSPALVHGGLEELVAEEILVCEANRYRFCHEGMREAARKRMDKEQRRRMHRDLGEALLDSAGEEVRARLEAGLHLLSGGEETRGADILAQAARKALRDPSAADDTALAVRALGAALEVYEKQNRGDYARAPLLLALGPLSYYVDWRLAIKYGEQALAVGFRVSGLLLASKLKRFFGTKLALIVALIVASVRFRTAKDRVVAYGVREAIGETCAAAPGLAGVYAVALDVDGMRRLMQLIEPLLLFGRNHVANLIYEYCRSRVAVVEGREADALEILSANASRLDTTEFDAALGERPRQAFYAGEVITIAIMQTHLYGNSSLETAGKLDEMGVRLWSMFADQCRMIYYANCGRVAEARVYRDKVELNAVQGDSTWQTDIFVPTVLLGVALLTRDLVAVREAWEQLARRGKDFPSLEPYAEAAHAAYLTLRGNHVAAIPRWVALMSRFPKKQRAGWMSVRWAYAGALSAAGDHAQARKVVSDALALTTAADHAFALPYAEAFRQLALSEAGLGNFAEATRILDEVIQSHEALDQPLVLGSFHAARAQVALAMADGVTFSAELAETDRLFRKTGNPSLIAQWEELASDGARAGLCRSPAKIRDLTGAELGVATSLTVVERTVVVQGTLEEQWDRALELVVSNAGASSGYLYLLRAERLQLVAANPDGEPPESIAAELLTLVTEAKARRASQPEATSSLRLPSALPVTHSDDDNDDAGRTLTVFTQTLDQRQSGPYRLLVLTNYVDGVAKVVGGVVLLLDAATTAANIPETAKAVARALSTGGDGPVA